MLLAVKNMTFEGDLIELSAHVRSSSAAQAIIALLRASFSNASCRNRGDMLGHVL